MPDLSPAEVNAEENPRNGSQYFPSKLDSMTSHMTPPHLVISPQAPLGPPMPCSSSPAATAEAPELSYGEV